MQKLTQFVLSIGGIGGIGDSVHKNTVNVRNLDQMIFSKSLVRFFRSITPSPQTPQLLLRRDYTVWLMAN